MRVLIVGVKQETATFSPARTTIENFEVVRGEDARRVLAGTATEVGGALDVLAEGGIDVEFGTVAWAPSGGPVDVGTWHTLRDAIVDETASSDADGVLLVAHGAMVSDDDDDPDGTLLQAIRRGAVRRPLVATLDLHAIVTDRMIDAADVLVPYHTYPHVDHRSTGARAAGALLRLLRGDGTPTTARVRVPLLARGDELLTESGLLGALIARCRRVEDDDDGFSAGVFIGNPFTDVADLCSSVLVCTADDPHEAIAVAEDLAARLWDARSRLRAELTPVDEAMRATAGRDGLVVLADQADATSSGAAGDSVVILRSLLGHPSARPAVMSLVDAPAVGLAKATAIGGTAQFTLGGTVDRRHAPLDVVARVVSLHADSTFEYEDGTVGRAGDAAVLEVDDIHVLVTSRPVWVVGQQVFRAHGLNPLDAAVVVVKSPNGYRPHYERFMAAAVTVDGDGATSAALTRLPYRNVGRPIWPLDDIDRPPLRARLRGAGR